MAPVAEEDDSFVAGSIVVEDGILDEGVSVTDVPGLAFPAGCGGASVRAVQSRRTVRAVSKVGHVSPEGNKTTDYCTYCITGIFPGTFISRKLMILTFSPVFKFPVLHMAALILNFPKMLPSVFAFESVSADKFFVLCTKCAVVYVHKNKAIPAQLSWHGWRNCSAH